MSELEGKKFDEGKDAMALIPPTGKREIAKAMTNGLKYGKHNYLKGMPALRLLSAVERHINDWQQGEKCAPDSGVHHLGHAAAGLLMLIELEESGRLEDDRQSTFLQTSGEEVTDFQGPQKISTGEEA